MIDRTSYYLNVFLWYTVIFVLCVSLCIQLAYVSSRLRRLSVQLIYCSSYTFFTLRFLIALFCNAVT